MLIPSTNFSERSIQQVERARRAHASVPAHLRRADPLLHYTSYDILHQVNPNPTLGEVNLEIDPTDIEGIDWRASGFQRYWSGKLMARKIPMRAELEAPFRKRWYQGGDHYLLQEILDSGCVPLAWGEDSSPSLPRSLHQAQQTARERGYSVPDRFLTQAEGQAVSYSESEALNAAYTLVTGSFHGWRMGVERDDVEAWRPLVCQLTAQFIIPDPLKSDKTPYIVDQLWVVAYPPELKVRFLAVEIDGEVHLSPEEQERSRRRDAMLLAMGYEVYHLAGWWCRIDPFRAIYRFLEAARLGEGLVNTLYGASLASIDDYLCGLCGNPIVRWSDEWLVEIRLAESGEEYIAHGECARYLSEYRGMSVHDL